MIVKKFKHLPSLVVVLAGLNSTSVFAQESHQIKGTIFSQDYGANKKPLANATVAIQNIGLSTTTDHNGNFSFSAIPAGQLKINVSYVGRVTSDTVVYFSGKIPHLEFLLRATNFRLQEADVTAKNENSYNGTSSLISRNALDHLQANSLADVMALLPGGTVSNQDLTGSKQINIRNVVGSNSNANAFGTGIVLNGTPMNNNANLQTISATVAGNTAPLAGGANPSGGFDTRLLAVDHIESIEIIRGVPSVEHGDITNGLVIVKTQAGQAPLRINAKTNPNVYQLSLSKGLLLGKDAGALNIALDYAKNTNDPVQSYLSYQRFNANSQYSNSFFDKRLRTNSTLSVLFGKDTRRQNPDDAVTMKASSGRDLGLSFNTEGNLSFTAKWLKNINYVANIAYTNKTAFAQEQQTSATAPYSMTKEDGTMLTNKPGMPIYDVDGHLLNPQSLPLTDHYAHYLPSTYLGMYNIYGKEFSTFLKAKATFFNNIGNTQNKWSIGADYRINKNFGKGTVFSPTAPPYRNLSYVNSTYRPRAFQDIPAFNQFGAYAENQFSMDLGERQLAIAAGIRYDVFSTNKQALSPRVNLNYELVPRTLNFRAAYGKLAKGPSLLYLYPQAAYFEYININEMADSYLAEEERVFMTTTRSFETKNTNLNIASNERIEIGTDLFLGKKKFSITAFRDHLRNGYAMGLTQNSFKPVSYIEYERTGDNSKPIYEVAANNPVLAKYNMPTNNRQINTKGVEIDFSLGRFENIRTEFALNGAWIRNESYSNDYHYFDDNSTTGGAGRTHIALYDPNISRSYEQSMTSTLTTTHNIPKIGFVVTLRTQVIWNEINWNTFGNDSIPIKYISKFDGKVHDFDPAQSENPEFKPLMRNINRLNAIRESFSPLLSFHINISKEIADLGRISFFANNMFRHYQIASSQRIKGYYYKRNVPYYFGMELSFKL
ncbi:TonB-dependent receptor [Sphingobacterium kitahiroshimense]|uniref:TonB-dependent receptor n=1 Tax=Sphingobacterium sp. B16(2022) TaxID=2914044 RepID=UPI00143BEB5D|nr:carboxypeptidase-like regulatory domain-containing protein [Sphingobacterium sp. B16(2022)]NJI71997.1 TonB-dependent receptor [Sphingobacterium sp. B16(2022)]